MIIATLAIGIGAGTAVFSIASAVLLRPLPHADPARLVRIFETNPLKNWTRNIASPANYADWTRQNTVFTDVAAYEQFKLQRQRRERGVPDRAGRTPGLKALGVTGNLFTEIKAVDRDLALTSGATMRAVVDESMGDHRFRTTLLSLFAGVALLVAALGIYGVPAYFVSQRSRELGIRLALGAKPEALFRMVVGQGMRPVGIGAVLGLAGAVTVTRLMQSLLFGVTPVDPAAYAVATATLAVIALAACAVPALRATRVDPLVALRDE